MNAADVAARRRSLWELFEVEAERWGDAPAVTESTRTVSYRALLAMAANSAHALSGLGLRPGGSAVLHCGRSIEAIAAILGSLRLGALYAPIDPRADHAAVRRFSDVLPQPVIVSESALRNFAMVDGDIAPASCKAGDLPAYVMFTSGSTGKPKGVVVPHRAVVRLIVGQQFAELAPGRVMLHAAPLAFDASTFEIWGALLTGGHILILPEADLNLQRLCWLLGQGGVHTAWLTAGLFQAVVDHDLQSLRGLPQLLIGGDVLSAEHVKRVLIEAPQCRLINGYGPTENTTFTCCHRVALADTEAAIPIGLPIADDRLFVLDANLRAVEPGVAGQLAVAGDGVALGYLGDSDLTSQRFVPSLDGDGVMYLTGDLVEWPADGPIRFLGRLDREVKIDGKRVDLADVERVLRDSPGVRDAAVAHDAAAAGGRLVAAVRMHAEQVLDRPALLRHLRTKLPAHMVPTELHAVDALPLNANGKLDRGRLLATLRGRPAPATAGGTAVEQQLLAVFQEVLPSIVGSPDCLDLKFFDLGLKSLDLMRAHGLLKSRLNIECELRALFEHSSIRDLARFVANAAPATVSPANPLRGAQQRAAISQFRRPT